MRKLFYLPLLSLLFLGAALHSAPPAAHTAAPAVDPKWQVTLPGFAGETSPVLADLNNDTFLDVVVTTHNGRVVAVNHNGQPIFTTDTAPFFGLAAGGQMIASSPAVADLDNDGTVEIVVTTGPKAGLSSCHPGGIMVLNHLGGAEPGWPVIAQDYSIPPAGCPDAVYATPALADLDGNGDLEIVVGGFDKRIYALHHNGTFVAGFPPDSYLRVRFPTWPNLVGRLADTIWSSPAVADLNNDGLPEIMVGTDEGHFGDPLGGNEQNLNWYCPYTPPNAADDYCGGTMYVLRGNGQRYFTPPLLHWEHIQSSPALADLNNDDIPDLVYGTGTYYQTTAGGTYARRVIVVNGANGTYMPGWNDFPAEPTWGGGKTIGGATPASPAIGNITGDATPEIVMLALDEKVYAWHANGTLVAGFPMTPVDSNGVVAGSYNVGTGIVLGDYDGDNLMEIFVVRNVSTVIVDGNGSQLTKNSPGSGAPQYDANRMLNIPAVGDIDNDGQLELVVSSGVAPDANGVIRAWDLTNATARADWPMFKANSARTSFMDVPESLLRTTGEVNLMHLNGSGNSLIFGFGVYNDGETELDWTISNLPSGVSANMTNGTLAPGNSASVQLTINTTGLNMGLNNLGNFTVNATNPSGQPADGSPAAVPVRVVVVETLYPLFLPVLARR